MSGYYGGEFYMGSPQPFYDEVGDNPSPAETGAPYIGEIATVECKGGCASVMLRETGFLGSDFTNWFHLADLVGRWLILSKTYVGE